MSDENLPEELKLLKAINGFADVTPANHDFHTYIKKVIRHRARQAGFRRISTPAIESVETYERAFGENSTFLDQNVYKFTTPNGEEVMLKPEGTVPVVRSYVEHEMTELPKPLLLYYYEPHYRYEEKMGGGRYRQFWQYGFEIIGESSAALDAQLIQLVHQINTDLGVADALTLQINNLGSPDSIAEYRQALEDFYVDKQRSIPPEYKDYVFTNPLVLLDVNDEDCKILAELAPGMGDYLDDDSKEYFEELKGYLDAMEIPYEENDKLVRGLPYYSRTVFEFWPAKKGSDKAVGGGGCYDGLLEKFGAEDTPGVGYAGGVERMIAAMKRNKVRVPHKDDLHVFVAQLGPEAKKVCLPLMKDMRDAGLKTMGAVGKGSINAQLDLANKFKVPYAVLVGLTEVREGTAIIRNMAKGVQKTVKQEQVVARLVELIGDDNLDLYSPGELGYS